MQVKQHQQTKAHEAHIKTAANNKLISAFCKNVNTASTNVNTAVELTLVYHNIKHNLSYSSLDCGIKLLKHILFKSETISKIYLGRTKAEALATAVMAPDCKEQIVKQLKNSFYCVQTDASNVKNRKFFPIAVQYFNVNKNLGKIGVANKLLDFVENPDESANGMFQIIEQCLVSNNLSFKHVSSFSADNCNANFGEHSSLFTNLKKQNRDIIKANCHAHILHNAIKHSIDKLDYDIENLVLKLYSHFSISAKRRESLKDCFEFNESQYQELLRHVTTRWLSLLPCIERILKSWQPLLTYFRSMRDCPNQIKKLLFINDNEYENTPDNEIPEIVMLFCCNFLKIFYDSILKLESSKVTIIDVFDVFRSIIIKLSERRDQKFFGFIVSQKLKKLDDYKAKKIEDNFLNVLNVAINYIKKWFDFDENSWLYSVSKLNLKSSLIYNDVLKITEKLPNGLEFDLDSLFDEITIINKILELIKNDEAFVSSETADKWLFILEKAEEFEIPNVTKLISFILSIPATSAFVERVFSIMGNKWTDVRNRASVDLIKSELLITLNYELSCTAYYNYVKNEIGLLKKAQANEKYK